MSACGGTPALSPDGERALLEPAGAAAALIYEGEVVPVDAEKPAFRYRRWVTPGPGGLHVSTHLTFEAESPYAPVVRQRAIHTADYRLREFEETHRHLGTVSSLNVAADGRLTFTVRRDSKIETASEEPGAPVVVGPTLFGYARAHLAELRARKTLNVRFAAVDRCRTYDFTLRLIPSAGSTSTVEFTAASFLVRLAVAPMRFEFDDLTGHVTSYHGLVPPRWNGKALVADVRYKYAAATFF